MRTVTYDNDVNAYFEACEEGEEAYYDGIPIGACPYPEGSPDRVGWTDGWYTSAYHFDIQRQ
jgi:hypothetical protein